jgi:cold shock CspA family protein
VLLLVLLTSCVYLFICTSAEVRIKNHAMGTVTWFNSERGFGFIQQEVPSSSLDSSVQESDSGIFFHGSSVQWKDPKEPNGQIPLSILANTLPGTAVTFTWGRQEDGRLCAEHINDSNGFPFTMGAESETDVTAPTPEEFFSIAEYLHSATQSWQGHKKSNEDRFIRHDIGHIGSLFGLFDGHAGPHCW